MATKILLESAPYGSLLMPEYPVNIEVNLVVGRKCAWAFGGIWGSPGITRSAANQTTVSRLYRL